MHPRPGALNWRTRPASRGAPWSTPRRAFGPPGSATRGERIGTPRGPRPHSRRTCGDACRR
eukprot:4349814-Alexandrium_andersonii.AAC.1